MRVSTRTLSPMLQKRGTRISAPVSKCCGLEGVGCGVAFDSRFGVCNLKYNVDRHLACQDCVGCGVYHGFTDVALFQELYTIDAFSRKCNLFKCFGVHEVVAHVVFVKGTDTGGVLCVLRLLSRLSSMFCRGRGLSLRS